MITIAFMLMFVAVEGADECQVSTINGKCCEIPFTYDGKEHWGCTTEGNGDKPWCYTTEGNRKWDNCNRGCQSTKNGKCCKFPFKYKGTTYNSCTIKDNDYKPWCYTTEGNRKYSNCKIDCPTTVGCAKSVECCKFPFTAKGITINSCANGWCATTKNFDSTGCWTYCTKPKKACPPESTARCVLPFTYNGKLYKGCAETTSYKWCPTTPNYNADRCWKKCTKDCEHESTAKCVFPFEYKGSTYKACTNAGSSRKWCATTDNYRIDGCYKYCTKEEEEGWAPLQSNVCFGAKDSEYGSFTLKTGPVYGLKLVHKDGFVNCRDSEPSWNSNWGCNNPNKGDYFNTGNLATYITDTSNKVIYPPEDVNEKSTYGFYTWPGYNSMSPILEFSSSQSPLSAGTQLRIWYGEDLVNNAEGNNDGKACVDIYTSACPPESTASCASWFIYKGKEHSGCVGTGSTKWCATTRNYDADQCWKSCPKEEAGLAVVQSNVCFGAKGNSYGSFTLKTGPVYGLKLVHKDGFVNCRASETSWNSNWGCNNPNEGEYYNTNKLATYITDTSNKVIYPPEDVNDKSTYGFYTWPGYNSMSPTLEFSDATNPLSAGTQLRIWYGEDLVNNAEGNNDGKACVDIYAKTALSE